MVVRDSAGVEIVEASAPIWPEGGGCVARPEFPARFRVYEIGADHVSGVRKDELDVQSVRVYDLLKPRPDDPRP